MAKKILIVDDDPTVVKLLESKLAVRGYSIFTAGDGVSGLKQVEQYHPDLIIADYLMPRMDGFTFYKTLRKRTDFSEINVLILTERAQMEDSFRALGIEVFVTKPFMLEGLLAKIDQMLGVEEVIEVEPRRFGQQPAYRKVLIAGPVRYVTQDMFLQLQPIGCQVQVASTSIETVSQALEFNPDIVLIDVAMGDVPGHRVISIMRAIPKLGNKIIVAYHFFPSEGAESLTLTENMGSDDYKMSACMMAGATAFLGRFNPGNFLNQMAPYLYGKKN